jgi:hypothetical protein
MKAEKLTKIVAVPIVIVAILIALVWAVFRVEELVYNVDVGEYVQAKGP